VALSADRPEKLGDSRKKHDLSYTLLSDHEMNAARAFGIAFQVDDETFEEYKGYGIDLEETSGETHHLLPVPSVFLIDKGRVVRFVHYDPDYQQRLENQALLEAARKLVAGSP
jgi:peroxiredoxin